MNLEKQRGFQTAIKNLVDDKKITDQTHFPMNLTKHFKKGGGLKTTIKRLHLFSGVDIPKLSENQAKLCEEDLTGKTS